jgi:acyl-CoA synthetase (AMP-forming)/AMP-acid ligase II
MQWLLSRFESFADQPAFHEGDSVVTYGQFAERVSEFCHEMTRHGAIAGDAIVIEGNSDSDLFAAVVASMHIGLIVAPLTNQSPVSSDAAEEIIQSQWKTELNKSGFILSRTGKSKDHRSEVLNDLTNEGLGGLVLFSSGSTGIPKGILYDSSRLLEKFRVRRDPIRALAFLLLDHFGGINTVLTVLSSGGEIITLTDRNVDTICEAIETHQVKILPTTPSFIRLLLVSGAKKRYNLTSLRKITFGTEPMTVSTLKRLAEEFPGVELQQTYGLSEVGVLRTKSKSDGSLWMRIGGNGFDWKVKNGILWIRSEYQMRGYLNANSDFDDEGYFNTQDEVLVDGDFIQVLGRKSEIINVGGVKVYPAEIENCLEELQNIERVVAYASPNPILGQVIAVDVVLHDKEDLADLKERLRKHCRLKLGDSKAPTKVRIVDAIQLSGRMKTIRHE